MVGSLQVSSWLSVEGRPVSNSYVFTRFAMVSLHNCWDFTSMQECRYEARQEQNKQQAMTHLIQKSVAGTQQRILRKSSARPCLNCQGSTQGAKAP